MHEQPVFRRMGWFTGQRYPVAERLARRGFYVPSGMALADDDIATVAERVREVLALAPSTPEA
jgi:perosamine synthetase